jgi:hypothetical protein
MLRPLEERISRGREAIAQAKTRGLDVSEWEAHLTKLRVCQLHVFRIHWPAVHADADFRDDVVYFAVDEGWARMAPPRRSDVHAE